ncbi:GntR family transcriptional regulator, partial [Clostridioides difficile]
MWQLKKEQNVPIYRSIMEMIVQKIQTGELLPGEKIPSERKLAEYLSVNRSTVVHALDELVDLGWIVRKRGSGTIVNEGKWGVMMT